MELEKTQFELQAKRGGWACPQASLPPLLPPASLSSSAASHVPGALGLSAGLLPCPPAAAGECEGLDAELKETKAALAELQVGGWRQTQRLRSIAPLHVEC